MYVQVCKEHSDTRDRKDPWFHGTSTLDAPLLEDKGFPNWDGDNVMAQTKSIMSYPCHDHMFMDILMARWVLKANHQSQ